MQCVRWRENAFGIRPFEQEIYICDQFKTCEVLETSQVLTLPKESYMDRSVVELNRASRERIRAMGERLSDAELQHPVGQHWTVAIVMAHIAFWERRVMYVLDKTEPTGEVFVPNIDIFVNDLSL